MPRVIGIDPGTVSIDLCGIDDGKVFLDRALRTSDALADPSVIVSMLEGEDRVAPLDLVIGPSGYGVPLTPVQDLSDSDLRLAYLAAAGETGGIERFGSLLRALAQSRVPVLLTPGVVHLASVPAHRKVNRVDMGTADKVCAVALAIREQADRLGSRAHDASFVLLELGGAFTAALAVENGRIVDGIGGTSGPLGLRAAGALDGEVAFLAGSITKRMLFGGGVATITQAFDTPAETLAVSSSFHHRLALDAYVEGAVKAVSSLLVSTPDAREVILSGRAADVASVRDGLTTRLSRIMPGVPVRRLAGFASETTHAAQGAALIADGLAGGMAAALVQTLGIREASGTVLDHLYFISPGEARKRLGIP
jgi:predicted butyrate kinase (DUF1464 family)